MGPSTADDPRVLDATAALRRALLNLLYTTVEAPTEGSTTDLSYGIRVISAAWLAWATGGSRCAA